MNWNLELHIEIIYRTEIWTWTEIRDGEQIS